MKLLPLCLTAFALGWWSAQPSETEVYSATFKIVQESGSYGPGIRFFGLQRIESSEIDMATCSIDEQLPLARAMSSLVGTRTRLTLNDAGLRKLER